MATTMIKEIPVKVLGGGSGGGIGGYGPSGPSHIVVDEYGSSWRPLAESDKKIGESREIAELRQKVVELTEVVLALTTAIGSKDAG